MTFRTFRKQALAVACAFMMAFSVTAQAADIKPRKTAFDVAQNTLGDYIKKQPTLPATKQLKEVQKGMNAIKEGKSDALKTTLALIKQVKRQYAVDYTGAPAAKQLALHETLDSCMQAITYSSNGCKDNDECDCAEPVAIKCLPAVILCSGNYCLPENLTYTGDNVAITVAADLVTINMNTHSLVLQNPAATGVSVTGSTEFTLLNGKIISTQISTLPSSSAVLLNGVQKSLIEAIFTENTTYGVEVLSSSDTAIQNSHMKNHIGSSLASGIQGTNVNVLNIDNCTIEGTSGAAQLDAFGINIAGTSTNCSVTNTRIPSSDIAMWFGAVTGLLVENCTLITSPYGNFDTLQLGHSAPLFEANDVIIRNCTFINPNGFEDSDGFYAVYGSGLLVENCVFDFTIPGVDYTPAAIHIGCGPTNGGCTPTFAYNNAIFRNCVVQGAGQVGAYVEAGSNITFDNCQVSAQAAANYQFDVLATNCTVKNSSSSSSAGYGIFVNGASFCTFENNTVNLNQTGVFVTSGSSQNSFENNSVFSNTTLGFDVLDTSTKLVNNFSCQNGTDCSAPYTLFQQQAPGAAPVVGSNTCCGS